MRDSKRIVFTTWGSFGDIHHHLVGLSTSHCRLMDTPVRGQPNQVLQPSVLVKEQR